MISGRIEIKLIRLNLRTIRNKIWRQILTGFHFYKKTWRNIVGGKYLKQNVRT